MNYNFVSEKESVPFLREKLKGSPYSFGPDSQNSSKSLSNPHHFNK